jgi:cytochrome o ubiquinol oxidase subunit II
VCKTLKDSTKPIFNKLVFSGIILLFILLMQPVEIYLFIKDIAFLFPSGSIALEQRNLLFIIQAMMLIVIVPVYVFTFLFSWWYRADNTKAIYDPHLVDHKIAEIIWWGVPFVLVAIISVITWKKTYELDPFKPIVSDQKTIKIDVVALQWKWLFIYPEENIATVNYIRIPKDHPVHFQITADAPMNSFWIPSLGGQIYAMPGMKTQLHLIANEEGQYRGSSANISGEGFAGMTFITEATDEESYQAWLETAKQSPQELNMETYQMLASPSKNSPAETYRLEDDNLFRHIVMKYMEPNPHLSQASE